MRFFEVTFSYELVKTVALVSKYAGIAATSYLTWINLHRKTAIEDPNSPEHKALTSAGRKYRAWLIVSFALTLSASIFENIADNRIKEASEQSRQAAEQRGNEQVRKALETQYEKYVAELETKVTPKIDEQTQKLNSATSRLRQQISATGEAMTWSNVQVDLWRIELTIRPSRNPISPGKNELHNDLVDYITEVCGYDPNPYTRASMPIIIAPPNEIHSESKEVPINEDCRASLPNYGLWLTHRALLEVIDPTAHLNFRTILNFNGFRLLGGTDECVKPVGGKSKVYKCLRFEIETATEEKNDENLGVRRSNTWAELSTTSWYTPGGEVMTYAGESRGFAIDLLLPGESSKSVFQGRGVYLRDADLRSLELIACDPASTEQGKERELHLRQFMQTRFVGVRLRGLETETRKPYSRDITLRESDRTVPSKYEPYWQDPILRESGRPSSSGQEKSCRSRSYSYKPQREQQ